MLINKPKRFFLPGFKLKLDDMIKIDYSEWAGHYKIEVMLCEEDGWLTVDCMLDNSPRFKNQKNPYYYDMDNSDIIDFKREK